MKILGDKTRLSFSPWFSLQSHAVAQPALTLLTIVAIALSVALAVALQLSSQSLGSAFERSAQSLVGSAELEITAGDLGIPESLLQEIQAIPGIAIAAPLLEETVRPVDLEGPPTALRILGVDLLSDSEIRSYTVVRKNLSMSDPLRLMSDISSVIISDLLAKKYSLEEKDQFSVRSSKGIHTLTVRGILAPGGISDAYGGQIVVMDVYSLQEVLDRRGWLDRIDITLEDPSTLDAVRHQLETIVAGRAFVRTARSRQSFVAITANALRLLARIFAGIGILVAALLSYGALSVSVDRRIRDLALLQAIGLENTRVRRLVLSDALILASIGTTVGILCASTLSGIFITLFSQATDYLGNIQVIPVPMSSSTYVLGICVGLGIGIIGALPPAFRASTHLPLELLATTQAPVVSPARTQRRIIILGTSAGIGCVLLALTDLLPATVRVALVFILGLFALLSLLDPLLVLFLRPTRLSAERILPGIARVVGNSLRLRINNTRITVGSIAGIVAAVTGIWVCLTSVMFSLDTLNDYREGIMVTATDFLASRKREPISPDTAKLITDTPEVIDFRRQYITDALYQNTEIRLSAVDAMAAAKHNVLWVRKQDDLESIAAQMENGAVLVSDSFIHTFGTGPGETITLLTPKGPHTFPIVGIRASYSSNNGMIEMDLSIFDAIWERDGSSTIVVWSELEDLEIINRIQKNTADKQPLFFLQSELVKRAARDSLNRYRSLLYVFLGLIIAIGGLSVMNLLIGSVAERRRDLALLRAAGATDRQVIALVIADGLIVAVTGVVAGTLLGLLSSIPILGILRESFGWVIYYDVSLRELFLLTVGTLAVTIIAGLFPAWEAQRAPSRHLLAPE